MLWEDNNSLMHYGIKGQRWGVRRFQNEDGSLTPEGRKRYRKPEDEKVKAATKSVKSRLSNRKVKIEKEPHNVREVMKRARISESEADRCLSFAEKLYREAAKEEPKITNDVVTAVVQSGSNMYGLDYRLKQPTSLAGKIGADAKELGTSFESAAAGIKDTVRYTSVSDDDWFVYSYNSTKEKLLEKGYRELTCKNFFEKYREGLVQHKAVQCIYVNQNGFRFEIQFQTPESQAVKNLKIPLYEERRKRGISAKRAQEIEPEMHALAESIPYPKGIEYIESHG